MVQLSDLFTISRLPGGVSAFILFLYFPAGLVLAAFRFIFCIQLFIVLSILPKNNLLRSFVLRVCGLILGFVITSDREKNCVTPKVIVANHVSLFDGLVMESLEPVLQPYAMCHQYPSFVCWLMDYICEKFPISKSLEFIKFNEVDFQYPVILFPEETTTNGQKGLLKFNPEYTSLLEGPVQPVAICVSRPPTSRISITLVEEHFWIDLFWTFFVPFTHYHISYLPQATKMEDDRDEDFAKRIQRDIAYVLDIAVTPFSLKDKNEYKKKLDEVPQRPVVNRKMKTRSTPAVDSRQEEMTRQVKDVFPQCPVDIVRKDIARTKDVNLTLTNILEGRVSYRPLSEEQQEKERTQMQVAQQKQLEKAKETKEVIDQLSFQEKKKIMIAEARKKYLEKHPEFA